MTTPSVSSEPSISIAGRPIGPGRPAYVIAELSANHRQDLGRATELVHVAKSVGADAIKLQTYTADTMTIRSDRPAFRIEGTVWEGRNFHDLYGEAMTPWDWHPKLKAEADSIGLHLFSTPFDPTAVEFLQSLDVPAYKVASFELVDLPLIRRIAEAGKPLVMSTGMATVEEIDRAVSAARSAGAEEIALLRCSSAYPATPAEMDLRTIPHMAAAWGVPVGLSDHTLDLVAPLVAVAMGASLFEKHLTLSRAERGPDSAFSLEPDEFRTMVDAVHAAEQALGGVRYGPSHSEEPSLIFRRSLYAVSDIAEGEPLTPDNVRSIRPAGGLPPGDIELVLGRRAATFIERGTPISWALVGSPSD